MAKKAKSETYVDSKNRTRWYSNDELAEQLKRLFEFLVIGNYEESHAARYPRLAHAISRYPESVQVMKQEGRLEEIPGVSKIISVIITELIETGTCTKMDEGDEFFTPPPKTVLQMTAVPRLGAKTAKLLYQQHGIDSFQALLKSAKDGSLQKIKGIGKAMIDTILEHEKTIK